MYQKYVDGLIDTITTNTNITIEKYFGELENPSEGKFLKGSLPIVYIDFIKDDTSDPKTIYIDFALYIVHISYSKNKQTRINTQNEIYKLLKDIYKHLDLAFIEDSDPVKLKELNKIYDASAKGGYVTVYKKDISIGIPNPISAGEI